MKIDFIYINKDSSDSAAELRKKLDNQESLQRLCINLWYQVSTTYHKFSLMSFQHCSLLLHWKLISIKIVFQTKNFENTSVNTYETGSLTKFEERNLDINFFDDVTKSNLRLGISKQTKKNRTFKIHNIWKSVMS